MNNDSKVKNKIDLELYEEIFGPFEAEEDKITAKTPNLTPDNLKPLDDSINNYWKGKHIEICPNSEDI